MKHQLTTTISFSAQLTLNEDEIGALDALVGYGDEAFLKAFAEKLGEAYMGDHKDGLKSFFATVRRDLLPALAEIQQTRRDLREAMKKRMGGQGDAP